MNLFTLFRNKSRFFWFYLGFLGMINSVWASALLFLINNKISGTPLPFIEDYEWMVYVVLIVISFIVSALFQSYMIRLTYDLGNDLGLAIFDKLRFTNYEDYLKYGEEKVRAVIQDVHTLQRFPDSFLQSFDGIVMVTIGTIYLFWIDPMGTIVFIGVIVSLIVIYVYRNKQIRVDLDKARDLGDVYHQNVNDFVGGFKEIKMSMEQSDNIYHKYIVPNRNMTKDLTVRALIRQLGNELLGSYSFYLMIGAVLFLLPALTGMSAGAMSSFLVTLLFLMGPIAAVVRIMEIFIHMKVALQRINDFDEMVKAPTLFVKKHGDLTPINEDFKDIRFDAVSYEYENPDREKNFKLDPISLTIKKGETIFITGGNGSGKSTFINLLSGLYLAKEGQIFLNDHLITQDNKPYYRNQISSIFTDNYLFTDNYYGFDLSPSNKRFMELLEMMELTEVVTLDPQNGKISYTLSKGQQKRMALIYALLDDKDILIFDEWAAEQDPIFRKHFYRSILPRLKEEGKTVIAVTHDDAYFDCAERIIKFDYGKIVKDAKVALPV